MPAALKFRYPFIFPRNLWQEFLQSNDIDVRLGDNGNRDLTQLIRQRPIGHLVGNQFPIRDNHFGTARTEHDAGADANALHAPDDVVDLNNVTNLDRALKQDNQARDKIIDDILQAKADADTEGTRDDSELRHVDAERAYGQYRARTSST